jgi:lipopolysaccharide assembly outer membrane protein LptD (OstA)
VNGAYIRDLAQDQNRSVSVGFFYQDECLTLGVMLSRDFGMNLDRNSGDSIFFALGFRNLTPPAMFGTALESFSSDDSRLF